MLEEYSESVRIQHLPLKKYETKRNPDFLLFSRFEFSTDTRISGMILLESIFFYFQYKGIYIIAMNSMIS